MKKKTSLKINFLKSNKTKKIMSFSLKIELLVDPRDRMSLVNHALAAPCPRFSNAMIFYFSLLVENENANFRRIRKKYFLKKKNDQINIQKFTFPPKILFRSGFMTN